MVCFWLIPAYGVIHTLEGVRENGNPSISGYTGLVQNEAGWWYVVNGQLDFGYTGTVNWNGATYRVINGNVVF